jgi:hypothetical protein
MLPLIGLGIIIWAILILGQTKMLPWLNKHIFSKIWCEEPRKQVARETIDRLKELMVDGDVPEETALLMVAKEQEIEAKDILQSFDADDAKELIQLLSAKNPSFSSFLFKSIRNLPKKNMRGSL